MMKARTSIAAVFLIFALAFVVSPVAGAPKLPPGVTFKVLAEFPSDIKGIEKVQLQELRLEPGAKWENILIGDTGL